MPSVHVMDDPVDKGPILAVVVVRQPQTKLKKKTVINSVAAEILGRVWVGQKQSYSQLLYIYKEFTSNIYFWGLLVKPIGMVQRDCRECNCGFHCLAFTGVCWHFFLFPCCTEYFSLIFSF